MNWQDWIVALIITCVVIAVARYVYSIAKRKDAGCNCGCCGKSDCCSNSKGCDTSKGER